MTKAKNACRDHGGAINGVMSTLTSVVLVVHLILNVVNSNNNNNNNNNNDNNDNNNNNKFAGQLVAESEFDNEYGTMTMGMGPGKKRRSLGRNFLDFDDYEEEELENGLDLVIGLSTSFIIESLYILVLLLGALDQSEQYDGD